MRTRELDSAAFREMSEQPFAVIDCYGDNCFACRLLEPIFDDVASRLPEISFGRVNVTRWGDVGEQFGIMAFPTVLFFRAGQLVHQTTGSMSRESLLAQIGLMLYGEGGNT